MAHDLVSLITVLEQDRVLDDQKKVLVESLLEKVTSLKSLLEKSVMEQHRGNKEMIQELQSEIRDAAHEAEDIIESHAVDQMLSEPDASVDYSMSKVMENFDAANDKLTKIIKEDHHHHHQSSHDDGDAISNPSLSVAADNTNTARMVGFDDDILHLKGRLTSDTRMREIIPIVGMGGIGKTTLARNLYNDRLIVSHFDVRAWVIISQDYNVRAILSGLLGSISGKKYDDMNSSDLGDTLSRRLCGQRYLLVLDDIWSEKAWDEIQRYFPKEENRSRILITSRVLAAAKHPDPACKEHQMRLLSDDQGWDLLRHKVFEKDEYGPPFLEEVGRKIASSCGGLPLAISVIGGLLSVDKYSKSLWYRVARDVRSIADNHISEILSVSYDNLPLHLKPCFLYMSAFPEDYEVPRSKLVNLLVAEGFMSRKNNKSLEDVAEVYLKALVDRNLLSVATTKYNGRAESFSLHDLLRDLCVRKAEGEKFLRIFKHKNVNSFRRVSVRRPFTRDAHDLAEILSSCRSFLYISPKYRWINFSSILSTLRLVKVLDVYDIFFDDFPVEILKLANLSFLSVRFKGSLPSALWRLRNLQTLLVCIYSFDDVILSSKAWEMSGLRHIKFKRNKGVHIYFEVPRVHENLQTISGIHLNGLLASNLINNIPNIKKLKIYGHLYSSNDRIIDLSHLDKLETLILDAFSVGVLSLVKLPNCLKKLSLYNCTLPMGLVNGVGDLQYLQALKIKSCWFEEGEVWEVNEGVEFCSLQFLEVRYLMIKRWIADYSHFPSLTHLRIRGNKLEEIPDCFGEMSTLEMIEVNKNNPSHVAWANKVQETQRHEYGNESLRIRILN